MDITGLGFTVISKENLKPLFLTPSPIDKYNLKLPLNLVGLPMQTKALKSIKLSVDQ